MIGWLHRIICLALSYDRDFMFYFFGKRGFNCIRFSILLGRKKNTKGWTQPSSNNEHAVSTMGGIWSDLNAKVVLHSHCNCICQRWCMCMDRLLLETASCLLAFPTFAPIPCMICLPKRLPFLTDPVWQQACVDSTLGHVWQYFWTRVGGVGPLPKLWVRSICTCLLAIRCCCCKCTSKLAPDNSELTKYQYVVFPLKILY